MDKPTFAAIVSSIVAGFEDPAFRSQMAAAKSAGDVGQLIALPTQIQTRAFAAAGLDADAAMAEFKAAGRQFGADADLAPMLARMKAALA